MVMEHDPPHIADNSTGSAAGVLHEIDATLDALEQLSRSISDERDFYSQLLSLAAGPIEAVAGCAWTPGPQGQLSCTASLGPGADEARTRAEQRRLSSLRDNHLEVVGEGSSQRTALSTVIMSGSDVRRMLAFYLSAKVPAAAHHGFLQYIEAIAEIAARFEYELDRRYLAERHGEVRGIEQLVLAIHRDWDLSRVAYAIANEGRTFLNCDRLCVAVRRGRRFAVLAVSGADVVQRRSRVITQMESLVDAVAKTGETLIADGGVSELPRQIADPLSDYVDVTATKSVVVVPLKEMHNEDHAGRPIAALLAEHFTEKHTGQFLAKLSTLSDHAAIALERGLRLREAPLARLLLAAGPMWARLGWQTAFRTGMATLLVGVAVAVLSLVPASLQITVHGEVQPVAKSGVFASADGIVENVIVREDATVEQGQIIATLTSKDLDLELQRVSGELATATERLGALDAERLQARTGSAATRRETSRLSADELTLKKQIENLRLQLKIIQDQVTALKLTSPLAGQVLTENVDLLIGRPVQRGQRLLEVANLSGPWKLRFLVPDRRAGHVLRALDKQPMGLAIRFVMANRPEQEHLGTTTHVGLAALIEEGDTPVVPLEATFDRDTVSSLRPGATVVGKIDCGQKPLGFVWFHEVWEEIRRRFF